MDNTLQSQLQKIPNEPGIYQYYDKDDKLLYVGKAKNLKKRVKSYFTKECSPNPKNSLRIQHMVAQIAHIHTIIVANEHEALILENSFIKSQNPKYNILLRDDKTYPYITINLNDCYPRFSITRRIIKHKDTLYFGPYPKGAKEILQSLYELFPIVQQASCLKGKKPCLYYQIGKCLGVCSIKDSNTKAEYDSYIQQAITLMKNTSKMQKILESSMLSFAEKELFEQAKICKDCIEVLQETTKFCAVDMKKLYNADVYSFVLQGSNAILFKLFVRDGKVVSTHHQFVKPNMTNDAENPSQKELIREELACEIYTQALLKILKEGTLCDDIILADISTESLQTLKDSIPEFANKLFAPQKGEKLRLATLARTNALHILTHKTNLYAKQEQVLQEIKELFSLDHEITSIEVFDTSHHSSSFIVGGMVSYVDYDFYKPGYRHYNLSGKDEYSQMREMLTRRAKSFDENPAPSLWLLDGGLAQINLALEILESSGARVSVLAIAKEKRDSKAYRAKGHAKDIVRSKHVEFRLQANDPRLQFLQKLRDEAHRFAITFHRNKKVGDIRKG
nr:excinuclease ABC subunit UvrC [Helicobacter bilis]